MRLSDSGLAMLKSLESCKLNAYQDSRGIWTIGYGETQGVKAGMMISQETADELLLSAIESVEKSLSCMVNVALTSSQWDALVSFIYNVGSGEFHDSELLHELNTNAPLSAANEFMRWIFVDGEPSDGQYKRRKTERAHFLGRI